MRNKVVLLSVFMMTACGSSDNTGGGGNISESSILDGSQATYGEMREENNNSEYEQTDYILDSNGIAITGTLLENSTGTTGDAYTIFTGPIGIMDLQIVLDGVGLLNDDSAVWTRVNAVLDDGVSTLTSNSFRNIQLTKDVYYKISIVDRDGSSINNPYTIEIKASDS